jgi:hypothetical protein
VFVVRLIGLSGWDRWFGLAALTVVIPMLYLLGRGIKDDRPAIYFVWIAVVLVFQAVEFMLDFVLWLDFRGTTSIVIPYVVLFFAALGGLLGLTSQAGRHWIWAAGPLFLIVGILAFASRFRTGI